MRLSDFFPVSNKKTAGTTSERKTSTSNTSRTAILNRQIQSLKPGQTISGEIISKNGNEVQIRLSEDMVLNARLEQNLNLEMGKGMTFEVKNNGSSLTLSPLFANTATDANILKALDMASLPVNEITVSMTQALMENGLSVDKNSLQQVYREINANPQAELSDIVDLHRLGLPVTEENLEQIAAYKNLNHQITEGMSSILGEVSDTIQNLVQQGDTKQAWDLTKVLLDLVNITQDSSEIVQDMLETVKNAAQMSQEGTSVAVSDREAVMEQGIGQEGTQAIVGEEGVLTHMAGLTDGQPADSSDITHLVQRFREVLDSLDLPMQEYTLISEQLTAIEEGNVGGRELLRLAGELLDQGASSIHSSNLHKALSDLLSDRSWSNLLSKALQEVWTIRPQDLKNGRQVDEAYHQMNRQLQSLSAALENAGQSNSNASKGIQSMAQNLDFLQQLNQVYTYVQLPLKMNQDNAHGELYVYTNKKHLASKEGNMSALLHLDMENLGPVDIYVAIQGNKVSTRFLVMDDSMLDFLADHISILNQRLEQRGYNMKCEMQVREPDAPKNPTLQAMLEENSLNSTLVKYAFDVRA